MAQVNRHSGVEALPVDPTGAVRSGHGTLPPPEWTAAAESERGAAGIAPSALARLSGPRAEEAWLRARVRQSRAAEDAGAVRVACVALARWLGARDRDLDEAVELAGAALRTSDDLELRRELSAWLESLGEPAQAAAVLKTIASMPEVESAETAYALARVGLLRARAGSAAAAAVSFEAARSIDGGDPLPSELLATLWAWEPDVVSAAMAVEAHLDAAQRRSALKQDDAELVDLWRAFGVDPASVAARALSEALEARGRTAAADEVVRAHAQAIAVTDDAAAVQVNTRRRLGALAARDPVRALGAAIDEGLPRVLEGEASDAFDAVLLDVGMLDVLAARLELRAKAAPDPVERGRLFVQLGRLLEGPLGTRGEASAAYAAALAADLMNEEASRSARRLAARSDDERRGGDDSRAVAWVRACTGVGDDDGSALERMAGSSTPPVRAVLLACAVDRYLAAGDLASAQRTADLATRADLTNARCVAALADAAVAIGQRDRVSVASLERAIGVIGPKVSWCFALADALDALGETELAAGWSQRCVTQRPGDRGAIAVLLDRLTRACDSTRLRDALAWLLTQPQPIEWASEPFARALSELARLDHQHSSVVARRALEVYGPKAAPLREAMLGVARTASDDSFAVAVIERWLSSGAAGADRRTLFLRLAELRAGLGDDEGVARIAARAAREGGRDAGIDRIVAAAAARPASSDARVWVLRANAERLAESADVVGAPLALRGLGAALWDLADDRLGALDAWQRAAPMSRGGYEVLARDIVAFGGSAFALDHLAHLADAESDGATSALISTAASHAALSSGDPRRAFELAARGIARNAGSTEAMHAAERAAAPAGELAALSTLYELAASRALGRFGRRAMQYRGARYFERSGDLTLALRHAAQAFLAVPSEGSTFQFLARAAERAGDRALAVRAIEEVAEHQRSIAARAAWLVRAASIAGDGEDGARRRLEVLLRALAVVPSVTTVGLLRRTASELAHVGGADDAVETRLSHAAQAIERDLDGPEGARIALALASMAFELFGDAEGALESIQQAFRCDADIEEFSQLAGHSLGLGQATSAATRLTSMLDAAEQPHANVGTSALRLIAAIASSLGDEVIRARACVAAAMREPEDEGLVVAADDALRSLTSTARLAWPHLAERFLQRVSSGRRAEALLGAARALVAAGAHGNAAHFFERAAESLEGQARSGVEHELRAALDAAGLASEIEARAHRLATDMARPPPSRALSWAELAQLREDRGDTVGAVAAQLEACRLDQEALERWSVLERVAEAAGDDDARIAALERIDGLIGDEGRSSTLKRLARAQERRGDLQAAERAWRRVLAIDTEDEEADQAIQSVIATRGDHVELVEHLSQRAERLSRSPDKRELLRAVRLRRAAILEQRLGRTKDACEELERLLVEWPDSVGALRYLADLYDRQSDFARSVELWRRAAAIEESPFEARTTEHGGDRVSDVGGDPSAVEDDAIRLLARRRAKVEAVEARRLETESVLGPDIDTADVGAVTPEEGPARADVLLQSAHAAVRDGDLSRGLARARLAVAAAQDQAAPQLLACWLAYRIRGAGAPAEARQTIEELSRIREPLGTDDAALRAFLLAEALDVVQGGGAGMRELEATRAVLGDHALVALGLAERLAAQGQYAPSIEYFRAALTGTVFELRRPGSIALAAAETSMRAASAADAGYFLDVAERHEDARVAAVAQRAKLAAWSSPVEPGADLQIHDLEAAVQASKGHAERARARLALAKGYLDSGDIQAAEPLLWEVLADGIVDAGDLLAPMLASAAERTRDLVRVRWQQVSLEPGDVDRLQSLRAAALANDDRVHARAVEHVLRAFDRGAGPLPPPPLSAQPDQPGILAMLARPSMDAFGEALALLWEGATQLFARDPASYGITGVERVLPGPSSPISRVYDAAMRLLGVPRIPLFVTRSAGGPLDANVALLSPPSVILAGDVRQDTVELRFELGRGIAAALPQNVLRRGLPKTDGRTVVDALQTAFGPPGLGRQVEARVARLAESFWQIIPASGQRRLQELLRSTQADDYGDLVERSLQTGRRVGMFLAGDFACSARSLLAESSYGPDSTLTLPNLRALCMTLPALADLLSLAVRSEYADARWHSAAFASPRRAVSSGRFSLF